VTAKVEFAAIVFAIFTASSIKAACSKTWLTRPISFALLALIAFPVKTSS